MDPIHYYAVTWANGLVSARLEATEPDAASLEAAELELDDMMLTRTHIEDDLGVDCSAERTDESSYADILTAAGAVQCGTTLGHWDVWSVTR